MRIPEKKPFLLSSCGFPFQFRNLGGGLFAQCGIANSFFIHDPERFPEIRQSLLGLPDSQEMARAPH
jgi:hypothetical protein